MVFKNLCLVIVLFVYYSSTSASDDLMTQLLRQVTQDQAESISRAQSIGRNYILHILTVVRNRIINFNGYHTIVENIVEGLQSRELEPLKIVKDRSFLKSMEPPTLRQLAKVIYTMQGCNEATDYSISKWESVLNTIPEMSTYLTPLVDLNISEPEYEIIDKLDRPFVNFVLMAVYYNNLNVTNTLLQGILENYAFDPYSPDLVPLIRNVNNRLSSETLANFQLEAPLGRMASEDVSSATLKRILSSIATRSNLEPQFAYQIELIRSSLEVDVLGRKEDDAVAEWLSAMRQGDYPDDILKARDELMEMVRSGLLLTKTELNILREDMIGHSPSGRVLGLLGRLLAVSPSDPAAAKVYALYSHVKLRQLAQSESYFIPRSVADISLLLNSFLTVKNQMDFGLVQQIDNIFVSPDFNWNALYRDFDFSKYSDPRRLLLGMLKHIVQGYKLQVCHVIVINYFLQQNTDNCSPMTAESVNNQLEGSNTPVLPVLVTSGDNTTGVVSALTPKNCTNGPPVRVIDPDCLIEIIDSKQHAGFITDLIKYNPAPAEKLPYNTRYEVFTALLGDLKENKYTDDVSEFVISQAMLRLPVNEKANFPPTYKLLCPEEIEMLEWKAPTTQVPVINTSESVPSQSAGIPSECNSTTQVIDRDSLWQTVNATYDWSRLQAVLYAEPVLYGDYPSLTKRADVVRAVLERRAKNLNNTDMDALVNTFLVMSPFTSEGQLPPVVLFLCNEKPSYSVNSVVSSAEVQEVQVPEITPTSSTNTNTIENIHTAETLKYTDATQTQACSEPCKSTEELTLIIDTDALLTLLRGDAPKARFLRSRIRSYVIPVTLEMNYTKAETLKYILDAIKEEMNDARVTANAEILKGYIQESGPGSEQPATSYACLPKGGKVTELCYQPRFELKECPQSACSPDETVADVIDTDSLFDALRPGAWKSHQLADMVRVYIMPIDPSKYYKKGDVLRDVLRDLLKNVNDTAVERDINTMLKDIVTGGPADERPRTVSVCFPKAYLIGSTPSDAAGLCVLPEIDQAPAVATGVSGSSRSPFPPLPTTSIPPQAYSESPIPMTPSTQSPQIFMTPPTPPPSQLPIVYPESYSEPPAPVVIGNTPFPPPTVSVPPPLPPKESAAAVAVDSSHGILPIPISVPVPQVETVTEPNLNTSALIQTFSQTTDTRNELISTTPAGALQSSSPLVALPPTQNVPNSNPVVSPAAPPAASVFMETTNIQYVAMSTPSITAPVASVAPPAVAQSISVNAVPEQGGVIPQPEPTDTKSAVVAVASPAATPGIFPIATTPNLDGISLSSPSPTQNTIVSSPPHVVSQSYEAPGYFTPPTRSPVVAVAAEAAPVADSSSTQLPPQYAPASTPTQSFQTVNYPLPQQITVIYPQGGPSAAGVTATSNGTLPQNMLVSVPSLLFHVVGVQPNPTVVTLPPVMSNPPPLSVAVVSSDSSAGSGEQETIITYPPYQPEQPVVSNPEVVEVPVSDVETPQNIQSETNPSLVSVEAATASDFRPQPAQPEITQPSPVPEIIPNNPSPPVENVRLPQSQLVQIPENAVPTVPAQAGSSAVAVDVDTTNTSLWQYQQVTLSYPSYPQGAPSAAAELLTITSNQPWPVQYISESSPLPASWSSNPSVAVAAVSSNVPWNIPIPVSVPSQQQQPVMYQSPGEIVVPSPTPGSAAAVAVDSKTNTYPPSVFSVAVSPPYQPIQPVVSQYPVTIPTQSPTSVTPAAPAVAVAVDSPNTNPLPFSPLQPLAPQSAMPIPTQPPPSPTPAAPAAAVAVDSGSNTNPPILGVPVPSPYQPRQPIVPQSPVTIPTQPSPLPTLSSAAVAVAVDSGTGTNPPPVLGLAVSSPYPPLQPVVPQSSVSIPAYPPQPPSSAAPAVAVEVNSATNVNPPLHQPLQPIAPQSPTTIPTQPPPSPVPVAPALAVAVDSPTYTNLPPYQPLQPVAPQSPMPIPTQLPPSPTPAAAAVAVAVDSPTNTNPPPILGVPVSSPYQPLQPIVAQAPVAITTLPPPSPTPAEPVVAEAIDSPSNINPPPVSPLQPLAPQSPMSIPTQPQPAPAAAAPAVAVAVDSPTYTNPPPILGSAISPPYQPLQPVAPQSPMPNLIQPPPSPTPAAPAVAVVVESGTNSNPPPVPDLEYQPVEPIVPQTPTTIPTPPPQSPMLEGPSVVVNSATNINPPQYQPIVPQSPVIIPTQPPSPSPAAPAVAVAVDSPTNTNPLPVPDVGVSQPYQPVQPIVPLSPVPIPTQPPSPIPAESVVAVVEADTGSNINDSPSQLQASPPSQPVIFQPSGESIPPTPVESAVAVAAADSTTNSPPVQNLPVSQPLQTEESVIVQSSGEVVPPPPAPEGPVVEAADSSATNPSSLPAQDAGIPSSYYPVQPISAQSPDVIQAEPNPPAGPGVAVAADSASNPNLSPPQPQLEVPQASLLPPPNNLQPFPVALSPPSYPSQYQSPNALPADSSVMQPASAAAASSDASPGNPAQPAIPSSPFSSGPLPQVNSESVNAGTIGSFTTESSPETTENPEAIYQGHSVFLSPSFVRPITPSPLQLSPYAQAMFPPSSPQPELARQSDSWSEGYPPITSFAQLIRSTVTSPPNLYQSPSPFIPHKVFIPTESHTGGAASASASQGNPPQGYFPVSVEQTTPGLTANNAFGHTTGTASSVDAASGKEPPTPLEGNYNTGQVGSQQGSNLEDKGSVISVDNVAATGIPGVELIQETTEIYYNPTEAPEMANIVLTAPSNPNASIGYMHPPGNTSLPGYYELLKWPILLKPEGNKSCYDNRNQVYTSPVLVINITSLFDVINPSGASELDEYLTATYLTSLDTYYKLADFQFKNHTTKEEFLRDVLQFLLKSEGRHDITEPMKRILNVIPETTSTPLQLGALCNYRIYEELPKRTTPGNLTLRYVSSKPCQSGATQYEVTAVTYVDPPKKVKDEMEIFSEMASRNRIFENIEWEKLPTQSDFGQKLIYALQNAAFQNNFKDLSDYLQREISCHLWKTSQIAVQTFCQPMPAPPQIS